MSELKDLPADQRAVLELVLARGRDYDAIAGLLKLDRAGVRQRALAALDALGPETPVSAPRRALITDYLLGQLPPRVAGDVRSRLEEEADERVWAQAIASALAPLASAGLPEVPGVSPNGGGSTAAARGPDTGPVSPAEAAGALEAEAAISAGSASAAAAAMAHSAPAPQRRSPLPPAGRPSSRTGGAILLALIVLVAIGAIIAAASSGGGDKHSSSGAATTPAGARSSSTSSTTASVTQLATAALVPASKGSKAVGGADAFSEGGHLYLAVLANHLAPNAHDYYAAWLTGGPGKPELVGYDRQAVGATGNLSALAPLRSDWRSYKTVILTLQAGSAPPTTGPYPTTPGTTILSGPLVIK